MFRQDKRYIPKEYHLPEIAQSISQQPFDDHEYRLTFDGFVFIMNLISRVPSTPQVPNRIKRIDLGSNIAGVYDIQQPFQ